MAQSVSPSAPRASVSPFASAHCPQCDRAVRVSEPFAFGGRDRLRSTLACGHVVARAV